MKLPVEIIWVALTSLLIGFVLGYGVRSFISLLRHRRMRRNLSPWQPVHDRRMQSQDDQDWRMKLEGDLSQVTVAPSDDASSSSVHRPETG